MPEKNSVLFFLHVRKGLFFDDGVFVTTARWKECFLRAFAMGKKFNDGVLVTFKKYFGVLLIRRMIFWFLWRSPCRLEFQVGKKTTSYIKAHIVVH
jgi:hypothetical protein